VLTQSNMPDLGMRTLNLHYTTMTNYDDTFRNVNVIYDKENLKNTLGEVLEQHNLSLIRIAETEKYPHVTFFFSGGRESEFIGEKRLMVNSPKVATYDLQPEMSALEVTTTIVSKLEIGKTDFVCLNFANPDMVGHTGDYNAIIKAVETVDNCTQKVVETGLKNDYAFIIIADHGNADFAINPDGSPNTAHSINMVPCFAINTGIDTIKNGKLGDIAPTILHIMGVQAPTEMNGEILIK
jgi:2,3-bisphosphoglycerate-independent phosphoglycerate mutase